MTEYDPDAALAGQRRPLARRPRRTALLLTIAVVAFAVDAGSKSVAVEMLSGREPLRLLGGGLYLTLARNTGAAFSMGSRMTVVFTAVIIVVVLVIAIIARRVRTTSWAVALGLILGGACGNLADRLFRAPGAFRGGVVDFISLFDPWGQVLPICNVADICIVSGGMLAVLLALLGRDLEGAGSRSLPEDSAPPARTEKELR